MIDFDFVSPTKIYFGNNKENLQRFILVITKKTLLVKSVLMVAIRKYLLLSVKVQLKETVF